MNDELDKFYELLGVAPGTSGQELKDAYRDLAKVWHPDRFAHDPRLREKAQEKLKEINEAYARLTSGKAGRRTRPAAASPGTPHAPAAQTVGRKRPLPVLLMALVSCAVFLAALITLAPRGARTAPDRTTPAERDAAQTSDQRRQPEGETRTAAGQATRGKERADRQPSAEATPEQGSGTGAPTLRPMPTVAVNIDAVTGQLATRDCPVVSTATFPAGGEPRQYCTARHKTKEPAKDSRLKSVGKRMATPLKWLGGEKGAEAGETRDGRPPGGGAQNR